jgi:hypothetical protein
MIQELLIHCIHIHLKSWEMSKKQAFIEGIPFTLLVLIQIYTLTQIIFFHSFFDWRNILGLCFCAIILLLFFINNKVYRYVLLVTLIFGSLSVISLTIDKLSIGISVGIFKMFGSYSIFKFEVIPSTLLILFIILNRKYLR